MSLKVFLKLVPLSIRAVNPGKQYVNHTLILNVHKQQISCLNVCGYRSYSTANKTEEKTDVKTVYYGMLTPQIKAVKFFSLSSSIVGIIAQPFLYKELTAIGNTALIIGAYSFVGFFTLVTPILLNLITKKYVTHLDYDEKTGNYIARTVNFFCITKKNEFKPEEVVVPDVPGMFTTLQVKGKSLFLDPRLFEDPTHYAKLMGYDKPIDFKLYETPPEEKKK